MFYADNKEGYDENDYNYPSDNYLSSVEYTYDDYPSDEPEKPILVNPMMITNDSEKLINEGHTIKLPCIVDKLGNQKIAIL